MSPPWYRTTDLAEVHRLFPEASVYWDLQDVRHDVRFELVGPRNRPYDLIANDVRCSGIHVENCERPTWDLDQERWKFWVTEVGGRTDGRT